MTGASAEQTRRLLQFESVTFSYGRRTILQDIDMTLRSGVTTLVGVNGAGKTTLLRLAVGALAADAGTVTRSSVIGFVPQQLVPVRGMTVSEYVEYFARLRGIGRSALSCAIDTALEATGTASRRGSALTSLSGGTLRRVAISAAIVGSETLVLDEPTAGLDPIERERLGMLVRDLGADRPVLFSTHLAADAAESSDRIVVLAGSRLVLDESSSRFFAGEGSPEHRLLALLRRFAADDGAA